MRNLKRVLSLALASVMLLGMMAIGAGAADTTYSDQSSITKEEAVAVMSAIGVFQGSDGKFSPTGDLTRETAAKIITYMLMGQEAADALVTSGAPFTDVAADRWSAGSIAYCVQNGIVAGDGQGHFFPEMTINGASFAKMLLVALGYNANTEKLVGTGWEVNVAKLAKSAKLTSGLGSSVMSKTLNREESAQMAFNTLKANIVEYTGGSNLDLGNGSTITIGGTRQFVDDDDNTYVTFNEFYFDGLVATASKADDFGRPATTWKNGAKTVGTYGSTADYIYTAKTDEDDIDDEIGDYFGAAATVVTTATVEQISGKTVATAKNLADLTKNGRAVEVYISDNEISKVVVIDTYLTTIASINTVAKTVNLDPVTYIKDADSTTGSKAIAKVTNSDDSALYTALAALGEDAYVLVVLGGNEVLSVAAPESLTGIYTGKTSAGVRTIGGEKYKDSYNIDASALTAYNTTYNIYLDSYGYLIGAEVESESDSEYAFLFSTEIVGSGSSGYTYNAKLLFTDGTQSWVEVASLNDVDTKDFTSAQDTNWRNLSNKFVSYAVKSNGTYTLDSIKQGADIAGDISKDTVDAFYKFSDATITKSKADMFGDKTNIQGSSGTIFLVVSGSTYTVYTGVKNVPTLTDADGYALLEDGTLSASVVVVTDKTNAVSSSSLVYLFDEYAESYYDSTADDTVYEYDAIVEGKIRNADADEGRLITTTSKDKDGVALTAGIYSVDYNGDGYGSTLTKIDAGDNDLVAIYTSSTETGVGATVSNGNISVASDTYVTADNFKAIVIDSDGEASEISGSNVKYYVQSAAYVLLDDDGEFAEVLIVVEAD
jgi:hypothetical protein